MPESEWKKLKDAVELTIRLIDVWPGMPTSEREKGPFSAAIEDTVKTLKLELRELSARKIVLQVALRERDLRLDGLPRADARPEHPGVILSFESRHGALRFPFDKFKNWSNNLRAIAMSLYHLRASAFYGVGSDGQAYQGWQALPAGDTPNQPVRPTLFPRQAQSTPVPVREVMSDQKAAAFLSNLATHLDTGQILGSSLSFQRAYREAAQKAHPDAGGSDELMILVNQAADVLKRKHGL